MKQETKEKISATMRGMKRSPETRKKMSFNQAGHGNNNWRGGKILRTGNGGFRYFAIYAPEHPFKIKTGAGYILEHRLIVERALGRPLRKSEVVHHINGDSLDNRNSNLLVCSRHYHTWVHKRARLQQKAAELAEKIRVEMKG